MVELSFYFFGKTLPFIRFCMSVFVTYESNTCCACYHSATILGLIPVKQVDSTSHAPRYLGQPSAMPSPAPLTTSYILIYAMVYFKQTKPKQDNYILSSNQFFYQSIMNNTSALSMFYKSYFLQQMNVPYFTDSSW